MTFGLLPLHSLRRAHCHPSRPSIHPHHPHPLPHPPAAPRRHVHSSILSTLTSTLSSRPRPTYLHSFSIASLCACPSLAALSLIAAARDTDEPAPQWPTGGTHAISNPAQSTRPLRRSPFASRCPRAHSAPDVDDLDLIAPDAFATGAFALPVPDALHGAELREALLLQFTPPTSATAPSPPAASGTSY